MDIKHNYIEKGQGQPLILLHGNGGNCNYFSNQIDEFSKYYRVIVLDTRGHGKTPRGKANFSISQFADDLVCFMDEKNIDRANILGFSDGGNIAMVFAINYPERIDSLIIDGANMTESGMKKYMQFVVEVGYHFNSIFAKKSSRALRKKELYGLMVNDPNITQNELKKITARTLVIAGTKDLIRESETKCIAESISNSELVFIKGPHSVAKFNPKDFNKVVLQFLKK